MTTRPSIDDNEVAEAASHDIAKEVYYWQNHTRKITDEKQLEEIRLDVLHILDYCMDGYDMAKAMEDRFYEADSQLVEIMEDATHTMYHYHCKRVEQWVIDNNIQPKLKVGEVVHIAPSKGKPTTDGEIFSINTKQATYGVCFPKLGHVKSDIGTHGLVLAYAYVEDQILWKR